MFSNTHKNTFFRGFWPFSLKSSRPKILCHRRNVTEIFDNFFLSFCFNPPGDYPKIYIKGNLFNSEAFQSLALTKLIFLMANYVQLIQYRLRGGRRGLSYPYDRKIVSRVRVNSLYYICSYLLCWLVNLSQALFHLYKIFDIFTLLMSIKS